MSDRLFRRLSIALLAGLLLWGAYGVIFYLHVPVHQMVLLADEDRLAVDAACGSHSDLAAYTTGEVLCRGFAAFVPAITQFFAWMSPLGAYVVISLVLFMLIGGGIAFLRGRPELRWSMSPWKVYAAFLFSLWLIFTTFSFGTDGQVPFRRVFEPTAQVFNVGPQALEALQRNFRELDARGCLQSEGTQTVSGAKIFRLKGSCIQWSFVTRVMPVVLFITFLLLAFLTVGKTLLGFLRVRPRTMLLEMMFSMALGACAYIVMLWALAIAGVLTPNAGWIVLLVPMVLCYPSLLHWLVRAKDARWTADLKLWNPAPILAWMLITYLALNFLNVVRPFPIGWDDLGSYMNRPRLLVSYGEFISTMSPFQWEYLTSLGFLLFGYDSIFGTTIALMINWSAGLLAVLAIFVFARTYRGSGGTLSALLYYSLPLVGHFSFADMKIDNAVFAMGTLALLAAFLALFPPADPDADEEPDATAPRQDLALLVLAGILAGFGFAMKATVVMVIFSLLAVMIGVSLHVSAFVATMLLAWGVFSYKGVFTITEVLVRLGFQVETTGANIVWTNKIFASILFLLGFAVLGWSIWKHRARAAVTFQRLGVFIVATGLTVAPWILHNNIVRGNIIPHFELAAANMHQPAFDFTGRDIASTVPPIKRVMPAELAVDGNNPICKATGAKEELDRYWGYSQGWGHYLSLPWRAVMNIDATGYYVTMMAALLLVPLLLLVPAFWSERGRWLRWLTAATGFMVVEWMFLANGIPWYGVGMFLGLCIGLEMLVAWAPTRASKITAGVMIGASLAMVFSMRMWQFDTQRNLLEYPLGKVTAEAMRERTIPHYDDVRLIIEQRAKENPQRPYVYRVGTFIPYFIPKNPERIALTDNQLDTFNCIFQERDAALTLKRLQAMGFNSIIFDTNTATIEQNPNGTLHQKVNAFIEFLNRTDLGMQVVINDPNGGIAYVLLP